MVRRSLIGMKQLRVNGARQPQKRSLNIFAAGQMSSFGWSNQGPQPRTHMETSKTGVQTHQFCCDSGGFRGRAAQKPPFRNRPRSCGP
jgi:hypothetical protein